ncbi:class I SAM-dependent methyltransferase [Natronomonas marina]|jgi:ubiquinone/menaquinone biosynthesis C-methylase UbiE|uniref:class I SAM-dependent methyltransferase n=1 Tax=Natronomonas marina TaxID=2961939 RepID=UPI0020C9E829|nr:class I SAM-dependent methyltransferase [Natronomonas marina]
MDRFRNTAQPDRDWWRALWPDPEGTLRKLGIDGGTLADVACGDGHFTLPAADIVDRVYAVDIDPALLADLDERVAAAGVAGVEPVEGDARDLPSLLPERVETALLANTFHGAEDPKALAAAVRRALTDDGRFVVVNWHDRPPEATTVLGEPRGPPEPLRLSPGATTDAVEAAGFEALEVLDLGPYHYGIVFRQA